jgi:hypothetical protein
MSRNHSRVLFLSFALLLSWLCSAQAQPPLVFEANRGQADRQTDFMGRARGYTVFLTSAGPFVALPGGALRIRLKGANAAAAPQGLDRAPGLSNYFPGSDPTSWRTNIPTYHRVVYRGVYPGIDIVYYAAPAGLEFDFRLAAGVEAKAVELAVEGAEQVNVGRQGVAIRAAGRRLLLGPPIAYQETSAGRRLVAARYVRRGKDRLGLEAGPYDRSKPLVIDPVLSYSTYLGGTSTESLAGMAQDAAGNIYLTGTTASLDFPLANAYQTVPGGVFITKLNPSGTSVIYSTYLGGPPSAPFSGDGPVSNGIAVDAAGNAYVVGMARQGDLPLVNPVQPVFGGGLYNAFVAKLDSTGSRLLFSTYLGGSGSVGWAVALDADGNPVVVGAAGPGFPTTPGALQTAGAEGVGGGFVAKVNAAGTALIYSTYLGAGTGGRARAIAVDRAGNAYVAGGVSQASFPVTPGAFQTTVPPALNPLSFASACFVSKLNPAGTALVYSTLLGGHGTDCVAIATDGDGNAFVTGLTGASDFPVTAGAFQPAFRGTLYCGGGSHCFGRSPSPNSFVTKLNPNGTALVYSTYLGGSGAEGGGDAGAAIALDAAGNAYVAGSSSSDDFPLQDAIQTVRNCLGCVSLSSPPDVFVAKLDPGGAHLLFSTYIGGSASDVASAIALDRAGNLLVAGSTNANSATGPRNDFPATRNALQPAARVGDVQQLPSDAFLLRISMPAPSGPVPAIDSATPLAIDVGRNVFSLAVNGSNFTPLSIVRGNGLDRPTEFVSSSRLIASGLPIDGAGRVPVSVFNVLANGEIAGMSNPLMADAPACAIPEPALNLNLDPGFYIAEVRTPPGARQGYWGMEVLTSSGTLAGGLHFGGGLEELGGLPAFGAFYVPSSRSARVRLDAQPLYGAEFFSMTARLLNSGRDQVGPQHSGTASIEFEQALDQGFYIVEIRAAADAPRATFQMSLLSDALAGGMDVGGFLASGLVGFGAFYLAERQPVSIRTLAAASYGAAGAPCLQLTLLNAGRNPVAAAP